MDFPGETHQPVCAKDHEEPREDHRQNRDRRASHDLRDGQGPDLRDHGAQLQPDEQEQERVRDELQYVPGRDPNEPRRRAAVVRKPEARRTPP